MSKRNSPENPSANPKPAKPVITVDWSRVHSAGLLRRYSNRRLLAMDLPAMVNGQRRKGIKVKPSCEAEINAVRRELDAPFVQHGAGKRAYQRRNGTRGGFSASRFVRRMAARLAPGEPLKAALADDKIGAVIVIRAHALKRLSEADKNAVALYVERKAGQHRRGRQQISALLDA